MIDQIEKNSYILGSNWLPSAFINCTLLEIAKNGPVFKEMIFKHIRNYLKFESDHIINQKK